MGGALPSGHVAFVFTDVEGSTRHLTRLGEAWPPLQRALHSLIDDQVRRAGGVVVDVEGDGCLCAFSAAGDAVRALAAAQAALSAAPWVDAGVRVRMAAHVGNAVPHEGRYTALAVHQAARLVALAHGGQILLSQELVDELGGTLPAGLQLRDLGRWHIRDFPLPSTVWQLAGQGLPSRFPSLRDGRSADGGNIPERQAPLWGREAEVDHLVAVLQSRERLVTVVGPGGVGKSSLAAVAARRVATPAWHVQLSGVTTSAGAALAAAEAVGVRCHDVDDAAWRTLGTALRDRRLLLLLDTCEHLLPGLAEQVHVLLELAPGVTVLATSREPLALLQEHVVDVAPLPVPRPGDAPEVVRASPAVALLTSRRRDARLLDEEVEAVAEVARALDGLPLALELVSTRLESVTAVDLLPRLHAALARTVRSTGPGRQRTLHATLQWSWDLISPSERVMWSRCSVFRSPFTLSAAEAVCRDVPGAAGAEDVLDALSGLVRRRLVTFTADAGGRYSMLDTVRVFGARALVETGEEEVRSDLHAEWALNAFRAVCDDAFSTTGRLQERVAALRAELLAALEHDVVHAPHRAIRTAAAGLWVWWRTGLLSAVADLLEPLLPSVEVLGDEAEFVVLHLRSAVLFHQGRLEEALQLVERAYAAALRAGVVRYEVLAVTSMAAGQLALGDAHPVPALIETMRALRARPLPALDRVLLERLLSQLLMSVGDPAGHAHADEALRLARRDAPGLEPMMRWHRSVIHLRAGDDASAAHDAAAGLAAARGLGAKVEVRLCLLELGWAQLGLGDTTAARRFLREARRRTLEDGDLINEVEALWKLAAATAADGDVPAAVALLEAAEAHPVLDAMARTAPGLPDLCTALVLERAGDPGALGRAERALAAADPRQRDVVVRAEELRDRLRASPRTSAVPVAPPSG